MTALNQFGNDFENLGVNRIGKVVGAQEFGNFFIGFVVGQNGAEQSLFGFQVLRQRSGVDLFHRGRLSCEKKLVLLLPLYKQVLGKTQRI